MQRLRSVGVVFNYLTQLDGINYAILTKTIEIAQLLPRGQNAPHFLDDVRGLLDVAESVDVALLAHHVAHNLRLYLRHQLLQIVHGILFVAEDLAQVEDVVAHPDNVSLLFKQLLWITLVPLQALQTL